MWMVLNSSSQLANSAPKSYQRRQFEKPFVNEANMDSRQDIISSAYHNREKLPLAVDAVRSVIADLDAGRLRVAEPTDDGWQVNQWVKEAILLYFGIAEMAVLEAGPFEYFDKIPPKKNLKEQGIRVVPPGTARYGSFLEPGAILMPGYVNIGAHVGRGTMVDTWALSAHAPKSDGMSIFPAVWVSEESSNHQALNPSSLKTAPSLGLVASSSRVFELDEKPF